MKRITTPGTRAHTARIALDDLIAAPPERRAQAYDRWLRVATPGEVRAAWRDYMGPFPAWADR